MLRRGPLTWYLDGAHTASSVQACVRWFRQALRRSRVPRRGPEVRVLLFNSTGDRDPVALLKLLQVRGQLEGGREADRPGSGRGPAGYNGGGWAAEVPWLGLTASLRFSWVGASPEVGMWGEAGGCWVQIRVVGHPLGAPTPVFPLGLLALSV